MFIHQSEDVSGIQSFCLVFKWSPFELVLRYCLLSEEWVMNEWMNESVYSLKQMYTFINENNRLGYHVRCQTLNVKC